MTQRKGNGPPGAQPAHNHRGWEYPEDPQSLTTWRTLIFREMAHFGETPEDAVHVEIQPLEPAAAEPCPQAWLDVPFHNSHGISTAIPFRIWTPTRVYFSHLYDGRESCQSVPRNPENRAERDHSHITGP